LVPKVAFATTYGNLHTGRHVFQTNLTEPPSLKNASIATGKSIEYNKLSAALELQTDFMQGWTHYNKTLKNFLEDRVISRKH
jgi:hypothetical protein